jgi:thiamine pyrophosphokinase
MSGKKTRKLMDTIYGRNKYICMGPEMAPLKVGREDSEGLKYKVKELEDSLDKTRAILNELVDEFYKDKK